MGKLVILIKVAPSGDVDTSAVQSNVGLSEEVADCIAAVALRAKFDSPGPNGSQISVPFNFKRQLPDGGVLGPPSTTSI